MTALLVVDKQRLYLSADCPWFPPDTTPHDSVEVTARIDALVTAAREQGVEVAWTVVAGLDRSEHFSDAQYMELLAIHGDTTPKTGEQLFIKSSYAASSAAGFDDWARNHDKILVVGGFSGRCVLATGFDLHRLGVDAVLVAGMHQPHPAAPQEAAMTEQVYNEILGGVVAADMALEVPCNNDTEISA